MTGTGISVKGLLSKIKNGVRILNNSKDNTIFAKLNPDAFKYDSKQKNIIYTDDVDSLTGIRKNKPIFKSSIHPYLSAKEEKNLEEEFTKTALGKEIYKHSDKYKAILKKQEEKEKNSPEWNASELANCVRDFYVEEKWKNKSAAKELTHSMYKIINMFRDGEDGKFDKAYAKDIQFMSKHYSKLNSNLKSCETVKKLVATMSEYK